MQPEETASRSFKNHLKCIHPNQLLNFQLILQLIPGAANVNALLPNLVQTFGPDRRNESQDQRKLFPTLNKGILIMSNASL